MSDQQAPEEPVIRLDFPKALEQLINSHSRENESNTPDFILASYLLCCLDVFDRHTRWRDKWSGFTPKAAERAQGSESKFAKLVPYETHMGHVIEYLFKIRGALPDHVLTSYKWLVEFRETLKQSTPLYQEVMLKRAVDTQPEGWNSLPPLEFVKKVSGLSEGNIAAALARRDDYCFKQGGKRAAEDFAPGHVSLYADIAACVECARANVVEGSAVFQAAARVQQYAAFRIKREPQKQTSETMKSAVEAKPPCPCTCHSTHGIEQCSLCCKYLKRRTEEQQEEQKSDAAEVKPASGHAAMSLDGSDAPNSATAAPEKWEGSHPPPADAGPISQDIDRDFGLVWDALTTGQHSQAKSLARDAMQRIKRTFRPGGLSLGQTPSEATYARHAPLVVSEAKLANHTKRIRDGLFRQVQEQLDGNSLDAFSNLVVRCLHHLLRFAHEPFNFDDLVARLEKLEQSQNVASLRHCRHCGARLGIGGLCVAPLCGKPQ